MVIEISGSAGGNQSFDNRQPYGTLNYAIALEGIFPSPALSADTALSTTSSTPFLGEIIQFAGNFAPRGYALCDGQILSIAQSSALFTLLGTTYGGDGQTTFALPDLRGRTPIGVGAGPGLTPVTLGQSSGTESVTLTQAQIPAHTHSANGSATSSTGGSQSHNTEQPTLGLTPVITLSGTFGDIGHIGWFAGNFAPRGHAIANGQLLPIAQNSALFALLGTTYGGNGQTTFALPDLRGRIAIDDGTAHPLGSSFGSETVTLTTANLPSHTHTISGGVSSSTGGSQSFSNVQPSLALSFEIATQGIFPSRNLQSEPGDFPSDSSGSDVSGLFASEGVLSIDAAIAAIEKLAQEGIARWKAAGISDTQIAQLQGINYKIADLEPGYLAVFQGDAIVIDADASNTGWFIDSTPTEDEEFLSTDPTTGELYATDGRAVGYFDLLTTIFHEQGHGLGFDHVSEKGSVMFGSLGKGGRLVPKESDLLDTSGEITPSPYFSVTESVIAEVAIFAGAPFSGLRDSFTSTNGQVLSITQNTALFSLLGTTYGGNGTTNFALPDFRDRTVLHVGQGPGLSPYVQGQTGGSETVTLTVNQMPAHTHTYTVANTNPDAVDDTPTTNEDAAVIINVLANDTDPNQDAISLTSFTQPGNGVLVRNDNGTAPQTDDTLTYTPNLNFNGTDTFTYIVSDGKEGTDTATVVVSVTAVNDAPSFVPGSSQSILEDSGAQTVVDWAGNISAGPANEGGQTLSFNVSNTNNGLFSVQPSIDPSSGILSYTPAPNTSGTATITVTLQDNGGTANGGANVSAAQDFTITVADNDILHSVSAIAGTITEGDSGSTPTNLFTLTRSGVISQSSTVEFTLGGTATNGADYDTISLSGTGVTLDGNILTFAPGATSATLAVNVVGDRIDEGTSEAIDITLSNATTGASGYTAAIVNGEATATLTDNDVEPNLSIDDVTVNENAGTTTFTVSLDAASSKEITVDFATADGTALDGKDYTAQTGTLTFAAGETEKTITVDISDDLAFEGAETFKVNLSDATNAVITDGEAVGTITDNESEPGIRIQNLKMQEGDKGTTTAVFNLKLSGASSETISVDYTTDNSYAKAGSDYKSTDGVLTFAPGETEKTVSVEVIGDRVYEKQEGFFVRLSNAENASIGKTKGKATIVDNDPRPILSVADIALQEGNRGKTQANFVLTLDGKTDVKTLVKYKTVDGKAKAGGDYVATTGQVTFRPGQTEKVVSVGVVGDLNVENDEAFQLEITRATAADVARGKATATIRNDDRSSKRGQEVDALVGAPVAIVPERDGLTAPEVSDLFKCELYQPELEVDSSRLTQLSSGSLGDTSLFGVDPLLSTSLGQGDSVLMAASQALI